MEPIKDGHLNVSRAELRGEIDQLRAEILAALPPESRRRVAAIADELIAQRLSRSENTKRIFGDIQEAATGKQRIAEAIRFAALWTSVVTAIGCGGAALMFMTVWLSKNGGGLAVLAESIILSFALLFAVGLIVRR